VSVADLVSMVVVGVWRDASKRKAMIVGLV